MVVHPQKPFIMSSKDDNYDDLALEIHFFDENDSPNATITTPFSYFLSDMDIRNKTHKVEYKNG